MSYVPACESLARHFLPSEVSDQLASKLAQHIQDAIEDWIPDWLEPVPDRRGPLLAERGRAHDHSAGEHMNANLLAPWHYDASGGHIFGQRGDAIAFVAAARMSIEDVTGGRGSATQIGELIAAAPDMYAALRIMVKHCAFLTEDYEKGEAVYEAFQAADASLAKAEGRAP